MVVAVVVLVPCAKVIESLSGHEWVDDDGDDIWQNAFYYGAFPDTIIFANKEFKTYSKN